jgi:hypothetical protein
MHQEGTEPGRQSSGRLQHVAEAGRQTIVAVAGCHILLEGTELWTGAWSSTGIAIHLVQL